MKRTLRDRTARYVGRLRARSAAIPPALDRWMNRGAAGWFAIVGLLSFPKVLLSPTPIHGPRDLLEVAVPLLLVAAAPLAGYRLAASGFPRGAASATPDFHFIPVGTWRRLDLDDARANPLFGPAGFMASLLIGLLLNVVLRGFEFLLAIPALNSHAPSWAATLFRLMAIETALTSFFYMVSFVMALRSIPLFPRMLLFVWALDIFAHLVIAHFVGAMPRLPETIHGPLQDLLRGNIWKVLISALLWLPYLALSDRVNVTYRRRVRASDERD